MLDLIRADLYRLVHGKALWVTSGALALFCLLAGSGLFSPTFRMTVGPDRVEQVSRIASGSQAPFSLMAAPGFLVLFFLPILITVACTDFTTGAIRNQLARGSSRAGVYGARLLLACLIGVVFDLLQVALPLISGAIVQGFGQPLDAGYLAKLAEVFLLQLPLYLGVISIGICLVFLSRKAGISIAAYLVIFGGAQLLTAVWTSFPGRVAPLLRYELLYSLRQAVAVQSLAAQDVARMVVLATGYLLLPTALGIVAFQKSDIQ